MDTMNSVDVSIVIITWNIRGMVQRCLETIHQWTSGVSYEVIVIDNHSTDGTVEMVRSSFPEVRLVVNDRNRGVAPARNQGIRIATGENVLILDADTELMENSVAVLHRFMTEHAECGIVGCKLVDRDGALQYTSRRFPTLWSIVSRRLEFLNFIRTSDALARHMMKDWDHRTVMEVDYVIGACQFVRRSVFEEVGLYDENIFYGPEDLDFCMRVWRHGRRVYYLPDTAIHHLEQRITKRRPFSMITVKHLFGIVYLFYKYKGTLSRD